MHRRDLFRSAIGGAAALSAASSVSASEAGPQTALADAADAADDRAYMSGLLQKIAEPVLSSMAAGRLKQNFKLELSPNWDGRDPAVAYMEAFGRLMSGVAPWLSLPGDATPEGRVRHKLRQEALQSFVHAVDPKSPDYLLWRGEGQALVDSAYVTNALIRAPETLWAPLDATTKTRLITEIKGLRRVEPPYTNWLLFAAMNEAFLLSVGEDYDPMRLNTAVRKITEWYAGDGWIKDGETFHFDYYGSFVMHPFMVEILEVMTRHNVSYWGGKPADLLAQALKRMQRYSEHLERFISPEGTFPPIGRSLTYRTAAFQPLALLAWRKQLPQSLPEGQARAALTAAHRAIFTNPSNFNDGYLTIGFAGHQPTLGDWYSNNGSMYITTSGFLALGLPETDSYWTSPSLDWTAKKAFANAPFPKDYHVDY